MTDDSAQRRGGEVDSQADGMLVVGIGASAGGIAALKQFFARVPERSGAAYAVVLHLSPDYESRLCEVLQSATSLPVTQVQGVVPVRSDHVYVIAPNASLTIADANIVAAQPTGPGERRAPVDLFFRTLADSYGRRAVAVVLSGTGPNGSSGLKRVKEHGGLAIAQDPNEAEYGDMPRNSIATGLVDYVLPVADIPSRLIEYHGRLRRVERETPPAFVPTDAEELRQVLTILRVRTGHDFSNYKPATILRRIERRLSVVGAGSLAEYSAFVQEHAEEAPILMKELLISVTNFFRDPVAYDALEKRVVPQIFHGKRAVEPVRAWVAGSATGEEAYSIAMLLAEHASGIPDAPRIQVFASDLDDRAIAVAREGFYTDAEVADVSHERLQRFFSRETGGYRVRRELREQVLFAVHNVIKDPPFSHLDLLACRNLLIYLNRSMQDRVFQTFHFALRPGGYLMLGTSESPDGASDFFVTLDKDAHIYEARGVQSRLATSLTEPALSHAPAQVERWLRTPPVAERVLPLDLHHRLIEAYAAPSLVVTDEHALVHVSQSAGRFLQVGRGELSRDVLQLIHPDLRLDLRTALHEAAQQRSHVTVRGVSLTTAEGPTTVDIVVRPVLREGDFARGFFLIVLEEDPSGAAHVEATVQLSSPASRGSQDLEEELGRIRSQLGATIEQYETQVEEAKASNEELQAANEELRSSTEELETSKEELQSVNEELTTVNQELKIKIEELRLTNNDFQNFINATSLPTIFLDRGLHVKLATNRAQEIFNLLPMDVGRPLSDITSKIAYEHLLADARQVLDHLHTIEREVRTHEGKAYLMRILPYRTLDDRIDGVVITFADVTSLRRAESDILVSEQRLRLLIDGVADYAIFTMTSEGRIDSWNAGAERMWGYAAEAIIGRHFEELFTAEDRASGVPSAVLDRARHDGRALQERYHRRADGTTFYASGVTTRLGPDAALGFAKIAHDLTASRASEAALGRAHDTLEERVAQRTAEWQHGRERVRGLLRKLVTAQEDQRHRIARDLHDQLGQQLTALRLTLERGEQNLAAGRPLRDEIDRGLALVAAVSKEVDFLAWELRPAVLDDLGLAAALPRFLRDWSQHYEVQAEFRLSGFLAGHLSKEVEVTYYRVAQEALNNVLKHAHASRVDVVLETRDGRVTLVVADDGVGFEPPADDDPSDGFGLLGMKERAALVGATIDLESSTGRGTTVYLRSPATPADPHRRTGSAEPA